MSTFSDIGLNKEILDAISDLGFETPTEIQAQVIPQSLTDNQDIIALAQTGTGKTAAFGLPAIHLTNLEFKKPQTLVLCPTRELCLQITKDLESYSKYVKPFFVVPVYGGASIDNQIRALKKGAHIVVATPGRAVDLINRKRLNLTNVSKVILDEADEMLTMGFKDDLDFILSQTEDSRQTLLFSATMSKEIMNIARKYMDDPLQFTAAKINSGAENVEHQTYMVHARDKYEVLKRIADINPNIYGIVFCRTRSRETKEIANKLMHDGYNANALHGDLSQAQRDDVMGKFRAKIVQILVATDVAARGLDVNDLTHVVNFHLPDASDTYTHRSGRTGRAGKSGISIAIIHTRENRKIRDIERRAGVKFTRMQVPSGKEICKKQLFALIDKIEKVEVDEEQIAPFLPEVYKKLDWLSREELIKHFVSAEFNRFLDYYKNAKDLNVADRGRGDRSRDSHGDSRRERGRRDDRRGRNDRSTDFNGKRKRRYRDQDKFTKLFINVGSKNDLNPARLIGLINEGLRSDSVEIGKIDIQRKFSFFEVETGFGEKVSEKLTGKSFEGQSVVVQKAESNYPSDRTKPDKKMKRRGFGTKHDFTKGSKRKGKSSRHKGKRRK